MTSFPIRIGPSDFLFYGKGSSILRVHAIHDEPLMVIFQSILRQANSDYTLEKSIPITPVKIEPSALVMNNDDKRAINVTFSPTHVSSFAIGKLLIRIAKLHTEEVIGTYQVPIFCLAACSELHYELFRSTHDGANGLTVINTGNSHGYICTHNAEQSSIRILSPGERICLSDLPDASLLFMAPLLAYTLMSLLTDDILSQAGIHKDVIADLKVELPESIIASLGSVLDYMIKMTHSIYSSYTSYPFRSNLLHFIINQCVWCNYSSGKLEKKPILISNKLADNKHAINISETLNIESIEPDLLSSSDLSVTLQPLANSARPIGGINDKMLSSSDSVPMYTNFPDKVHRGQPLIPPASTSTLDARRVVPESSYNIMTDANESSNNHIVQTLQEPVASYQPSNLCRLNLPFSSSTHETSVSHMVTNSSIHKDSSQLSEKTSPAIAQRSSITLPQTNVDCQTNFSDNMQENHSIDKMHANSKEKLSRMESPTNSTINNETYYATHASMSSIPKSTSQIDNKGKPIIQQINIPGVEIASSARSLNSDDQSIPRLPSEYFSTNASCGSHKSVTFTDECSTHSYYDPNSFHGMSSTNRLSTPTPSQSVHQHLSYPEKTLTDKTSKQSLPSGYDLQYKCPDKNASALEKELIDKYNTALSDYRCLSQTIKDNSRSVSKLVSDLKEERYSAPYMLEQELSDEYIPDVRPICIHFAEDSIIYNNPTMKWVIDGVPIYERPKYNTTMFWRVLNDSFLLGGSPFFPPYLESHHGVSTVGGICYLTGSVTIENNSDQSGFMNSLLQSEVLRNTNILDSADNLHYLYYSLSFVTFYPNILKLRLSIKANRPLTGCLSPGERHTIAITIAMAYSDVNGTDLPELPMFLQALNRSSDGMQVLDSGSPLFLRVFGARFDKKFFQDELESLGILQSTIRTPSRFSIRECIDLPVKFLNGIVHDRNMAGDLSDLRKHKLEMQNSRKGATASSPAYIYDQLRYESEANNIQCFNLPFLRFLASIPLLKVEDGQSITFPELLLYLSDVNVHSKMERLQQQSLIAKNLTYARNALASRPGVDVMFLSGRTPSAKQQKRAIDATCLQCYGSQTLQNSIFKGDIISASQSIPVIMPTRVPPGGRSHGNRQISISVAPISTPTLNEYTKESVTELTQTDSGIVSPPILTSAFECFITALHSSNDTTSYLYRNGELPPGYSFASDTWPSKTQIILSLNELERYSNVTKSTSDSTEYPIATITFFVKFTKKLVKRLLRTLSSCEKLPCFLEQKYEISINNFAHPNASIVSYPLLIRIPLQIDPSSLIFLKNEGQVTRVDRLLGSSAPQYSAQSANNANMLVSNCAMNVKAENINGFLDGLWTDSYYVNVPPSFAGAKSFSSISLYNASDCPIIAILSGLALPFSYRTMCRLEPLSSLLVPINFAPKRPGQYTGTLTVSYNQVVPDRKQEELLLQKRMLDKGFGTRHAFSKEHYVEVDALEYLTDALYVPSNRPKSASMWDNMMAKPDGLKCQERAKSSKTISRDGLSHLQQLSYDGNKLLSEFERSQIIPPGPKRAFHIKLSGLALNTPLMVTQPPSQLHTTHPDYELELQQSTIIYLQKATRTARILLTNVSDRALFYDIQLLLPGTIDSHDAAYHMLTVMPPSGCIEPKCQAPVSLRGEKQLNNGLSIVLNIYTKYRSGTDLMMALSYHGIVKMQM